MTTDALRYSTPPVPSALRALRPVGEILGFCVLFLILSLVFAAPIALATGQRTLGTVYILPFTLLFIFLYQRYVHRERLRELGAAFSGRSARLLAGGFFASGIVAGGVQSVQIGAGWMDVRAAHPLAMQLDTVAAGLAIAIVFKLGLGVGEELIFRGYILRRLLVGYRSQLPAVGISALVFVGAHVPQERHPVTMLNLLLLGVVLTLAVLLTRTLWTAIGAHAGWNFWIDGIAFDPVDGEHATRVVAYDYHIAEPGELAAFKLITAACLAVTALVLAVLLRQRNRRIAQESHS